MKKAIAILFAGALAVGGLAGCASGAASPKPAPTSETPDEGAYSADRALTTEDKDLFQTAMKSVTGDKTYEATAVATQVVAGTNYRFTVTVTEGSNSHEAYVIIFKPLKGDPDFVSEEKI